MDTNRMRLGKVLGALWVASALGTGCSSNATSDRPACVVGATACPCTAGGACDNGLTCLSGVCVDVNGTGATTAGGAGGTGGAAGSDGTGGASGASGAGGTAGGAGGASGSSGGAGGASGANGGGTIDNPELDQACAEQAVSFCQKVEQCVPFNLRYMFGDLATCQARFAKDCTSAKNLPGIVDGAARARACTAALGAASCNDWIYDFERTLPACLEQPGALADGVACGANSQCATTMCVAKKDAVCGVCGPAKQAGETCTYAGDCAGAMPCVNGVCVKAGGTGSLCSVNQQCVAGLVCKAGACAQPGRLGESCTAGTCDQMQDLYCASNRLCQAVRYAAPGEPCNHSSGIVCDRGGFCRTADGGTTGTCIAPAGDGAPCNTSSGPNCMAYAQCVNGRCQLPNRAACK